MRKFLPLLLFLLPGIAFGAGFAKQSLFLSKSPVTEGDTVLVHAVIQNDSSAAFTGEVVFSSQMGSSAKVKIGSAAASIAAQGAQAVSVSWKPLAGDYTVTASLTAQDGSVVEEESGHFTINPKPKPASTEDSVTNDVNAEVQSSADVQAMIAKFSPTAAGIAKPAFLAIDSLRMSAGNLLDQGISWSKSKVGTKQPGEVLGASTTNTSPSGIMGTITYAGATLALYGFSILKWLVSNAGVFYPVLALLFFIGLWKIFAWVRRPNY